jgi:predicted metal-dependent peptidase
MAQVNVKNLYDTCRSLTKQIIDQTKGNDGKKADPALLNALEGAFKQILDFERMYLIKAHNRFYGAVLMEMDMEVDFKQRGAVDLKVKEAPFRIGVNPIYCSDYTFPEFTFMIIQEIHRMIDLHPNMYARLNSSKDPNVHQMLDAASDATTSSIIERDVRLGASGSSDYYSSTKMGCKIPKDAYTVSKLNQECGVRTQSEQTLKYYFDILNKFKKKQPQQPQEGLPQFGMGGGSGSVATPENNQGESTHQWEGTDEDETKDAITSIVKSAYESLDERQRGMLPSGLVSAIQALLAPPQISWKQVLRKMVGSVPVPYRRTKTRLNRRQPYRADLSGKLPKRTVNIVCCFDTSGSMSDNDLKYCINEVFNIIKIYEGYKVTIIECDAEVQRVYTAKSMADVQTKMKGRGGTMFTPAIQYINVYKPFDNPTKYPLAGKFKDALMVYFTDGYGEYEIPKPKTYRNLWVVLNGEKNLSLKQPYGDVKSLSTDKDYLRMKGR